MKNKKDKIKTYIGIHNSPIFKDVYQIKTLPISQHLFAIVSHSEQLYIFSSKKNKIVHSLQHNLTLPIAHFAHSKRYKTIFLLFSDQTISSFSESLHLLSQRDNIPGIRHCEDLYYMDDYKCFVALFQQSIKLVFVEITTNHHRSLFTSSIQFSMKQKKVVKLPKQYFLTFSTKIHISSNYLYFHNSESVKVIDFSSDPLFSETSGHNPYLHLQNIVDIQNVCESPQQITKVLFHVDRNLLICGTNYGTVKVIRVNFSLLFSTVQSNIQNLRVDSQIITMFKVDSHNQKQILDLELYSPKIILSIGADQYIDAIDIDQMVIYERIKIDYYIQTCFFSSNNFFAIKQIGFDKFLYQNKIFIDYHMVFHHNSTILHAYQHPDFNLFNLNDNSLVSLYNNNDHLIKQSFIPPLCKTILSIEEHPFKPYEFWLLTEMSEIYKYKISLDLTQKIEIIGVQQLHTFFDMFNLEKNYKIVRFCFVPIVPIKYDEAVKEKSYLPSTQKAEDVHPVALGCSTGEILICSQYKMGQILFRTSFFTEAIEVVISLNPISLTKKQQNQFIFCFGTSKDLVISSISNRYEPKKLYKSKLSKNMFLKKLSDKYCALVSKNIITVITAWGEKEIQPKIWISEEQFHENPVTVLSYMKQKNLVVSGDQIGNINIWGIDGTQYASFSVSNAVRIQFCRYQNNELIFGFKGKIFIMKKQINENKYESQKEFLLQYKDNCISMNKPINVLLNINQQAQKIEERLPELDFSSLRQQMMLYRTPPKKQRQRNHGSLPQINTSRVYDKELPDLSPLNKVKKFKKRNKVYENLFHFPNKGLYSQLIQKNILL